MSKLVLRSLSPKSPWITGQAFQTLLLSRSSMLLLLPLPLPLPLVKMNIGHEGGRDLTEPNRSDTHPYVHSDGNIQAWFLWEKQATHAADWSYVFITEKCPGPESPVALLEADVWQAGLPAGESDQALMRQWLDQLLRDGVSSNAT